MNIAEKYTIRHIVTDNDTADVLGSGGLPVHTDREKP